MATHLPGFEELLVGAIEAGLLDLAADSGTK